MNATHPCDGVCHICRSENTQRIKRIVPGYLQRLRTMSTAGDSLAGKVLEATLRALDDQLNDLFHELEYGAPDSARAAAIEDELTELELVQKPLADHFLMTTRNETPFLRLAHATA